jgi:hypothetical protein
MLPVVVRALNDLAELEGQVEEASAVDGVESIEIFDASTEKAVERGIGCQRLCEVAECAHQGLLCRRARDDVALPHLCGEVEH